MLRTSRLVAALVAGTLSLGLAVGVPGSASAATGSPGRAGDWLQRQLTHGLVHNTQYDVDDYGLTADTGLALKTLGGHRRAVGQLTRALARNVNAYTRGGGVDIYAGATAKLAVLAQTVGVSPRHFGGVDLIRQLSLTVSSQPGIVGRVQDKSAYGDYANVISQSYAVGALNRARSGKARSATRFLIEQQCRAGYFRTYFADATAAKQSCDAAATRSEKAPDTDATAIAVLQLKSVRHPGAAVKRSIAKATRWLHRQQRSNGSFGGGPSTKAANANSTGLAGWALARTGRCADARQAVRWIAKLQRPSGAIAYDRTALKQPIDKTTQDQWRRATAQASPVLRVVRGC